MRRECWGVVVAPTVVTGALTPRRQGRDSARLGHALLEQGAKAAQIAGRGLGAGRVTGQVRRGLGGLGLVQGQADAALLPVDGEDAGLDLLDRKSVV